MAKRYELSDEAWDVVADLFTPTPTRGRPRSSDRLILDGVLWLLRSGAAWRDMPECFGPWRTVYHRFRVWRNRGIFDQMLKRLHLKLNDQGLIDPQTWMIDSTRFDKLAKSYGAMVSLACVMRCLRHFFQTEPRLCSKVGTPFIFGVDLTAVFLQHHTKYMPRTPDKNASWKN